MSTVARVTSPADAPQLNDPSLYIDRELSLLAFQHRVLAEAEDPENPLLERVKFLSILFSNLDEFFMVRFAVLMQKARAVRAPGAADGPLFTLLDNIRADVKPLGARAYQVWRALVPDLEAAGIEIRQLSDLTHRERGTLETYFHQIVFPVLTPLAFDQGRPFPHISNLSLNLAVALRDAKGVERFARVKIPDTLPQLVPVSAPDPSTPGATRTTFVWLEQLILANLHSLFPGVEILEAYPFRVTRDAEIEIQELESDDLLESIEEAVWQRRFSAVVRLQVSTDIPEHILDILVANLELDPRDVYHVDGALDLGRLRQLLAIDRSGSERPAFCTAGSAGLASQIRRRYFHGAQTRGRAAAPSVRFVPAGGRVSAPRRRGSGRARDQDHAVPRGPQFADCRGAAQRHRKRQAGGRAGGAEARASTRRATSSGRAHWKPPACTWFMGWWVSRCIPRSPWWSAAKATPSAATCTWAPATTIRRPRACTPIFRLLTADEQIGADATDLFNYVTGYSAKNDFRKLLVAPIAMRPAHGGADPARDRPCARRPRRAHDLQDERDSRIRA